MPQRPVHKQYSISSGASPHKIHSWMITDPWMITDHSFRNPTLPSPLNGPPAGALRKRLRCPPSSILRETTSCREEHRMNSVFSLCGKRAMGPRAGLRHKISWQIPGEKMAGAREYPLGFSVNATDIDYGSLAQALPCPRRRP
jgi:hypothetical protein